VKWKPTQLKPLKLPELFLACVEHNEAAVYQLLVGFALQPMMA
jgi:hypothetical protein